MAFIDECGGFVSAARKLTVQPLTLRKLFHKQPISAQSKQRIEAVFGDVGALAISFFSEGRRSSTPQGDGEQHAIGLGNPAQASPPKFLDLTAFVNDHGVLTAAHKLAVRPSTLKKILTGQNISPATRQKIDSILGAHQIPNAPISEFEDFCSRLKAMIKDGVTVIELSERLNLRRSTIQKIIDGKPLSSSVQDKLRYAIDAGPDKLTNGRPPMFERLQLIHQLYQELGTLAAVGKKIGVTRERVRQLLEKGTKLGLFEYKPFDYPYVAKEKILADYKDQLSLGRVSKVNAITSTYLRKLLTAYGITEEKLRSLWIEGQKAKCRRQYNVIQNQLGHHPTTTELQNSKSWRYLSIKITRLWGSIDSFRDELDIPRPPKGSPTFNQDTQRWREERQRLALIVRMQHLDRIRECLNTKSQAMSTTEIAYECGLEGQRTLALLKLLRVTGEIVREGRFASTKYRLSK
jgi:AraC-like DNA-binding protein